MKTLAMLSLVIGLASCDKPTPPCINCDPLPSPSTFPDNLLYALQERDGEYYGTLLDPDFQFTESDCQGTTVYAYDKAEEIKIMGAREHLNPGLLDFYRSIQWSCDVLERSSESPNAEHPDEEWEVLLLRSKFLLLRSPDEGYHGEQLMTFKLREGEDSLWRIVRWIDDPLFGSCKSSPEGRSS